MKMKAAVLEGIEKLALKDVPKPSPTDDEILLRVRACAICGSDIKIFHNGNARVKYPAIIGHEVAGEIVEAGKNTPFAEGERVALGADVPCGLCGFCRSGLGNCCDLNYAVGYQFPGGFAEYCLLNATTVKYGPVTRIPENVSYDAAAIAEPLACVLNGLELAQMNAGKTVLVVGAGPMGCIITSAARAMGASDIIVSEPDAARLAAAKKFGAGVLINPGEQDLVAAVKDATAGKGCDVVIVATPSAAAQEQAILCVAKRGFVNLFSGLPKGSATINVDPNFLHYNEAYVFGSHGCVPRHHKRAIEMIAEGVINVKDLITHKFSLDRIHEAFGVAESREGLKAIINP